MLFKILIKKTNQMKKSLIYFLFLFLGICINIELSAQQINVDFEQGFPANASTDYNLNTSSGCNPPSFVIGQQMIDMCNDFNPNQVFPSNMMIINNDDGNNAPQIVWQQTIQAFPDLGNLEFSIDFVHRGHDLPQFVNLELQIDGISVDMFTFNQGNGTHTNIIIIDQFPGISNGPNHTISLIDVNPCLDCDYAIDNIFLCSQGTASFFIADEDGNAQDVFCPGEEILIDASASTGESAYFIQLSQIDANGNAVNWCTSANPEWIPGPAGQINLNQFLADYGCDWEFEAGYTYNVAFAVTSACLPWNQTSTTFTVEEQEGIADFFFMDETGNPQTTFCYGEDVWIDGSASDNEWAYYIQIFQEDENGNAVNWCTSNQNWTFDEVSEINLTEFLIQQGCDWVFEPGYNYDVKLAIHGDCVPWTEVRKVFTVECCDDVIDPCFDYDITYSNGFYTVTIDGINDYSDIGATQEFFVFSSTDLNGPYEIGIYTSPLILDHGLFHTIIQKITTPCGTVCCAVQLDCLEEVTLDGLDGCAIIDNTDPPIDDTPFPGWTGTGTNSSDLSGWTGTGWTGTGTNSSDPNAPSSDLSGWTGTESSDPVIVPVDGDIISGSSIFGIYFGDLGSLVKGGSGPGKTSIEEPLDKVAQLNIYPNPSKGMVNIELNNINQAFQTLRIYDVSGKLIEEVNLQDFDEKINYKWKPTNSLLNGIYIVTLQGETEFIQEKILISQ